MSTVESVTASVNRRFPKVAICGAGIAALTLASSPAEQLAVAQAWALVALIVKLACIGLMRT